MAKQQKTDDRSAAESAPIPAGQKLFDNVWLWLVLSLLISGVLYNAWGLIEIFTLPGLTP